MFKDSFKYYKSKNPPPDLETVLDFRFPEKIGDKAHKALVLETGPHFFGFKPIESWDMYHIVDHPGLLFIKNPFTALGQRYWSVRCLRDYSKSPNKSNMDPTNLVPNNKDWWEICQSGNTSLLKKLRWITLGYHHNWDTKEYSEENRGEFPKDLKDMTSFLARVLGYGNFSAEAAIVNYYHMDSTLSGHTDHSERNLEAPLFSFSFGQSAVFLIGGKSLQDLATPLFLHSGDIVVMSKESRLCYHGVPKILHAPLCCLLDSDREEEVPSEFEEVVGVCSYSDRFKPFGDYLSHSRINVNVRQVLYEGKAGL